MCTAILPWLGRRLGLVLAVLVAGAGLMIATAIEASVSQQHSPSSLKNPGDPGALATYIVTSTKTPTPTPISTPFFDFRLMPTSPIFQYVLPDSRATFGLILQHLANMPDTYGIWAEGSTPVGWTVQFCIEDEATCYDPPDTQLITLQPGAPDLPLYVQITAPPGAPNGSVGSAVLKVQSFSSWEVKSLTVTAYVEAVRLRVYLPLILRGTPPLPTRTPTPPPATATPYYDFSLPGFEPSYVSIDPPADPVVTTFSTVLTHLGNRTDTYLIWAEDHTPSGWTLQFCVDASCFEPANAQEITLDPGAAGKSLSIKITTPAGAPSNAEGFGVLKVRLVVTGATQSQTGTVHIN